MGAWRVVDLHNVVGTLVVVAYLAVAVLYGLWAAGRPIPATRIVSMVAAALLLIQYVLGVGLISSDHVNRTSHYVFALLAIVFVGIEHAVAPKRPTLRSQALTGAVAAALTFASVLIAHIIGSSS